MDSAPSALFEHIDVNQADDGLLRRRRALGGAVQTLRARQGWKVADAAVHAHVAPMTFRRVEDGMPVREKTYLALDGLFAVDAGTVRRALHDDLLMVEIVRLSGVDTRHVAADNAVRFLDTFARQTVPGCSPQPEVTPGIAEALRVASQHVPTSQPTPLELAHRLVEQLLATVGPTPAVKALLRAALEAIPDLIKAQLAQCEAEVQEVAERSAEESASHVEHLVAS